MFITDPLDVRVILNNENKAHFHYQPLIRKTRLKYTGYLTGQICIVQLDCWMSVFSWGRSGGELIVPDKHQMIQLNKKPSYQRTDVILGRVRQAENAAKRFLQLLSKMSTSLSPLLQLLCRRE